MKTPPISKLCAVTIIALSFSAPAFAAYQGTQAMGICYEAVDGSVICPTIDAAPGTMATSTSSSLPEPGLVGLLALGLVGLGLARRRRNLR